MSVERSQNRQRLCEKIRTASTVAEGNAGFRTFALSISLNWLALLPGTHAAEFRSPRSVSYLDGKFSSAFLPTTALLASQAEIPELL